jgi:hypothetical protein
MMFIILEIMNTATWREFSCDPNGFMRALLKALRLAKQNREGRDFPSWIRNWPR